MDLKITILRGKQEFMIVSSRPYRRKNGQETHLLTLVAPCRVCGAEFTQEMSIKFDPARLTRTCTEHRGSGVTP